MEESKGARMAGRATEPRCGIGSPNSDGVIRIRVLLGLIFLLAFSLSSCFDFWDDDGGGKKETFQNPEEISSVNGVLDTTLVVDFAEFRIGNRRVTARVYNGSFTPPTFRVFPGDLIRIRLENLIDQMTSLHTHGLNVSPLSPGDNIFIMITPNSAFDYEIQLPDEHPEGTFYYHPHLYGLTEFQIMSGMSGTLIVEGLLDPFPQLQGIRELVMNLKDIQIDSDGQVPTEIDPGAPTHITLNGQINPRIRIRPGETQLWRIANIGADHYYPLVLEGMPMYIIARDGNRQNQLVTIPPGQTFLLPVSSRIDVLVQGGPKGTYRFRTLPFNTGPVGDSYDGATLATLESRGKAVDPIPLPDPSQFPPLENLCNQPVDEERTIVFSESEDGNTFFIDGKEFDPDRVDTTVSVGTLERWTVLNASEELHVFHIHQTDFQVCSINGVPQPFVGYQDTVNLPYEGQDPNFEGPGEVEIVINFRNPIIEGKFVYHCHIGEHEDNGMMAVIEAVD